MTGRDQGQPVIARIAELGEIAGDVVLFGGTVSNLAATEALIDAVGGRAAICTGDLAAYCAEPAETVAAIRATGWPVVAGNCERQLAAKAPDCGCGFDEDSACDRLSGPWYAHAAARIGTDDADWMAGLPDIAIFTNRGRRCAVIHGGVTQINRFLWPCDPDRVFAGEIESLLKRVGRVDMVVAGHAGLAFERRIGSVSWINAGSVGMPPHDGRPTTRYVVLHEDGARIRRLSYDHHRARRAMEAAGLTQGYHAALTSGLWPSEDALPPALRRLSGTRDAVRPRL